MLVDLLAEEQAARVEVGDQRPGDLGVLDEPFLEAAYAAVEFPVEADGVVEGAGVVGSKRSFSAATL